MKKLFMTMCLLAVAWMLTGCGHSHDWVEATCSEAKHCKTCGKVEGFPLQHVFKEATCTEPKTCTLCGTTEGEAKGHTWNKATFTEPKTCAVCGATEGDKISCTEVNLSRFYDDSTIRQFACLEHTILCLYYNKDDVDFFDYDGKKVATVDIIPDGDTTAYYADIADPPDLGNAIVLVTMVYKPNNTVVFSFYDEFGKIIGQVEAEGFVPEDKLYVRNYAEGHYLRINKTGYTRGYDAVLVIDTQTMAVADNEAGLDSLRKFDGSQYKNSFLQATIGYKYDLVFGKDGSYAGYVDEYGNRVAMYKDASPFNYYGFALVSEDGKTYDVVDSDLKVVGKGVAKGSHSGWAGSSVLYTLQDGKIHFYSIK